MELNIPILFLVFNRPETTRKVFEEIRKAQPPRLYIGADGPRALKEGENTLCENVRQVILSGIDWQCEVKTLFRNENLGCREAVSSAITWFFEQEEEGIILEDDTLPDQSFFRFCEELLHKYREDEKVMSISGSNLLGRWEQENVSYLWGHGGIWGWATWRRAWNKYDKQMKLWGDPNVQRQIRHASGTLEWYNYFFPMFESSYKQELNTWDIQWFYSILLNNGKSVNPCVNLVQNIGFGVGATHTGENSYVSALERREIVFPLIHPKNKKLEISYLKELYAHVGHKSRFNDLISKVLLKVKNYMSVK